MNPYLTHEQIRDFEDKIGWKKIRETNKIIGIALGFKPEVSYAVGNDGGYCYSPSDVYFKTEYSQQKECERWITEQITKNPNGHVAKEGYKPVKIEYYPAFHQDWNHLMEALKRSDIKSMAILIEWDIFKIWITLAKYINISK
jgi:hypothetical protein